MKVRLHSNEKSGAMATDRAIRGLPNGGELKKDDSGNIFFDENGLAEVVGGDHGFMAFALQHQGYVKEVIT